MGTNYSPAAVHVAIGVLMELHDCDPPQAIALLSSSAFNAGRTITALRSGDHRRPTAHRTCDPDR